MSLVVLVLVGCEARPEPLLHAAPMPVVPPWWYVLITHAVGDEALDVVGWSNDGEGTTILSVLRGDGAGGLGAPALTSGTRGFFAVADVTSDGVGDYLLGREIWTGVGDGTATLSLELDVARGDYGLIGGGFADVTADGLEDVFFAEPVGVVSWFVGDGQGAFGPKQQVSIPPPQDLDYGYPVASGRLTPDAAADVVRVSFTSIDGLLFAGSGQPVAAPGMVLLPDAVSGSEGVHGLVTADVNRDALDDLVIVGGQDEQSMWLAINLGDAGFAAFTAIVPSTGLGVVESIGDSVRVADLDGDACADLVFVGGGGSGYGDFFGLPSKCDGTFAEPVLLAPTTSRAYAAGDLDGDGKADLVTGDGKLYLSTP